MLLTFDDSESLALQIAEKLQCPLERVDVHHFPDGESRVRLPNELPERLILCRSLNAPNDKLIELMLTARCARDLGVRHITLAAPYLCYMRQDIAFQPGEAVSQRIVGDFLASLFDALVTADPHLHRTAHLIEAVPTASARVISAAPGMGEFLLQRGSRALVVGPDAESEQWVRVVARAAGLDLAVARKTRHGDREVAVELPPGNYRNIDAILVDDVASTGQTLAKAAMALLDAGAARVDALVTHALFTGDAVRTMHTAGISEIYSSDSIAHASNAFSLAAAFADALNE